MEKAFDKSLVFGCSSAGEKVGEKLMLNSVVALGLTSKIILDAKVEVIENLNQGIDLNPAFDCFSQHFNESTYTMDFDRYLGIVLIDGLSRKEEIIMDKIGNATNISFVGGSAGDYVDFEQTLVYANGKSYDDSAVICLLKLQEGVGFKIINTHSFKPTDTTLVATKVNVAARQVIEFNHQPATQAYADALGVSTGEIHSHFFSQPVGLVLDEDNILIRSPRHAIGSKMEFSANILEGMEVSVLEAGDIIEETKRVIDKQKQELGGKLAGIISFDCIYRRLEIDDKELVEEYGEIFKGFPSIGLCAYGEINVGFINQTSTMLILEYDESDQDDVDQDFMSDNAHLLLNEKNMNLQMKVEDLEKKLQQATEELKIFNRLLEKEIHERSKREEYIAYLSYHDELTGLYNRRYYEDSLIDLDNEDNLPLSIIVGDVNNLKITNDTSGHAKGDELLKKAAQVMQSACRQEDIIARIGGDEFVILLPNTSNVSAKKIVRRIESFAESKTVDSYPVSISFGWATKEAFEEKITELFYDAEQKMYKNKIQQKNL